MRIISSGVHPIRQPVRPPASSSNRCLENRCRACSANHSAIGLRSNSDNERRRKSVITSVHPSTTKSVQPRPGSSPSPGSKAYSTQAIPSKFVLGEVEIKCSHSLTPLHRGSYGVINTIGHGNNPGECSACPPSRIWLSTTTQRPGRYPHDGSVGFIVRRASYPLAQHCSSVSWIDDLFDLVELNRPMW